METESGKNEDNSKQLEIAIGSAISEDEGYEAGSVFHRKVSKESREQGKSEDEKRGKALEIDRKKPEIHIFPQRFKTWQPIVATRWITGLLFLFGGTFTLIGSLIYITSSKIIECSYTYKDPAFSCSDIKNCTSFIKILINNSFCVGPVKTEIKPPIYVYYELTNFYQNHRRYLRSQSESQLEGKVITDPRDVAACHPIIKDPQKRIYSPCGLVAWSVFNDSYSFYTSGVPPQKISILEDASIISWPPSIKKFKNPKPTTEEKEKIFQWLNEEIFPGKVENGHFINWMRSAALPRFRKLYAKIDVTLPFPFVLEIANRYPVNPFKGTKAVLLSTTSWLGGRNVFLAVSYLIVGVWCVLLGCYFSVENIRNPRISGDVRYLTLGNAGGRNALPAGSFDERRGM